MPTEIIPAFLAGTFRCHDYRVVDMKCLYVGVKPLTGGEAIYGPVTATPHYMFVRHVLTGDHVRPVHGYDSYSQYISLHPHPGTEDRFIELIESFRANGYDFENRPILVFRSWRRPWPINRWDVADGFHRLAILAAMGERHIQVAILKQKNNIFHRFAGRIIRRYR